MHLNYLLISTFSIWNLLVSPFLFKYFYDAILKCCICRYHSHHSYQYVDGAWGFLIIKNTPVEVWQNSYDEELHISINDWTHRPARNLSQVYLTQGNFPDCNSSLINGRGEFNCSNVEPDQICNPSLQGPAVINVVRGKRYRLRVLNSSGARTYNFTIDDHKLVVIETDGVDTYKSPQVDVIPILPAQRYSILVTMNKPLTEYWIRISGEPVGTSPGLIGRAILRYTNGPSGTNVQEEIENTPETAATHSDKPESSAVQGRPDFQDIPWDDIIANGGIKPATPEELNKFFPTALPAIKSHQKEMDAAHAKMVKVMRTPTTNPVDPNTAVVLDQQTCPPYEIGGDASAPSYYDILVVINVDDCPIPGQPVRQCMNGQPFVPGGTTSRPVLFQVIQGETIGSSARPVYTPKLKQVS